MATTQSQVSSGLRIKTAADNAAYWSISTTMRSDNKALAAAADAIGLGAAKVDIAYTGMSAVIEVLSEVKAKLVAAKEPGVDKAKIQAELEQLKAQVVGIAKSASFSGQNWLDTNIADIHNSALNRTSVVSSFVRNSAGGVAVKSMDIDLSMMALFNTNGYGLLQTDVPVVATPPTGPTTPPGNYHVQEYFSFDGPITLSPADSISFDLVKHPGGSAPDVTLPTTITHAAINAALGISTGTISDGDEMRRVLNHVWSGNGIGIGAGAYGQTQPDTSVLWHTFVIHAGQVTDQPDSDIEITNLTSTLPAGASGGLNGASYYTARSAFPGGPTTGGTPGSAATLRMNFLDIDVANGVGDQLDAIEEMLRRTTAAGATLGSTKMRIDIQADFAQTMMATIDKSIGRLVDADMTEASTRLKALQTQEQLGVQALQIANSNSENILALFR
jgi:flagellin